MCTCIPSPDWETQCEAVSRKTGERCPHACCSQFPNTLASHNIADGKQFTVHGRPVHLCRGHANSAYARLKRGLTVRLIDGGYLSAYNPHGFGSIVTTCERIDWTVPCVLKIPAAWPVVAWCGNVPDEVRFKLKLGDDWMLRKDGA